MSKCLLCQEKLSERQRFSDLFWIRKQVPSLCQTCRNQFEPISDQVCKYCCQKTEKTICQDCYYWHKQGQIVNHKALYHYNEQMMAYFSRYKFHGDYYLRKVFAKEVKLALSAYQNYMIVPIPISDERYEERGFNQVTGVLEEAGVSYHSFLKKHHSQKQSAKTKIERLQTQQLFYLDEKSPLPEKLVLVDDIYTTGATLQLAKALLMKNGAKTIKTFSIAR